MTLKTNLKIYYYNIFNVSSQCMFNGKKSADIDGDVYTGKETVEYLAAGVPDRVFFATNNFFNNCLKSYFKKTSDIFKKK